MRSASRLVCFFFFLAPLLVIGQESDSLDLIIKLPIKIDKVYNEFYVDSAELLAINPDSSKYTLEIIENIDPAHFSNSPAFSEFEDTLLVIIREYQHHYKKELFIVLTLNQNNELKWFYKSENQTFHPISFSNQMQFITIKTSENDKLMEHNILNPLHHYKNDKILGFIKREETQHFQVILTTGGYNGVASLKYTPDTSQSITSAYYMAKMVLSFSMKLQALYSFKNFFVGTYICYETNSFENNTRIISQRIGNKVSAEYSSHGNWPTKLLHFGITSGYDFLAFDNLLLSPTLNGGVYFYPGSLKPFDNEYSNKPMSHFKKKYSFGGGFYLKLPIDKDLLIILGILYQFNSFDASSYFTDIKKVSYHSRQELLKVELGISLRF